MLFCKHLMIAWIGLSRKQHVTKLRIPQLSIDISVSVFTNCDMLRDILLRRWFPVCNGDQRKLCALHGTDRCEIYRDACRSVYFKRESISEILK